MKRWAREASENLANNEIVLKTFPKNLSDMEQQDIKELKTVKNIYPFKELFATHASFNIF